MTKCQASFNFFHRRLGGGLFLAISDKAISRIFLAKALPVLTM